MKTLVILAGGKSSRMGKDKVFLRINARPELKEQTFIEHLFQKGRESFEQIIISTGSKEHGEAIAALLPEAKIVPDRYESIGPMGGLLSVYEEMGTVPFAVVPVDVPGAEMRVLSYFCEQCKEEACIYSDGEHFEPLIAAYGKKVFDRMKKLQENGCYQLRKAFSEETRFFSENQMKSALPELKDVDLQAAFRNINTIQEYENGHFG